MATAPKHRRLLSAPSRALLLLASALFSPALFSEAAPAISRPVSAGAPTGLMCDLMEQPWRTVITEPRPHFSWIVSDNRRGEFQSACEVVVATSFANALEAKAPLWDSGTRATRQSTGVPYEGPALASQGRYFWTVRTWDSAGHPSPWARPQAFRTGELASADSESRYSPLNRDFADRYPIEESVAAPVRILETGEGQWYADFGKAAFGTVYVWVESIEPGTLQVALGEVAGYQDATINKKPGGTRRYRTFTLSYAAGRHEYPVVIPHDPVNTRPEAVHVPDGLPEVMPFRYCELKGYPGVLDKARIHARILHYRFNDDASAFTSSDETLNGVWDLCKYTMKATSYLGVYVDGDRERKAYEADAYINQIGHYSVDREYTLARHSLDYLLRHPTWPLEWQHHDVMMAWEDWLATGDDTLLRRDYDELGAKTLSALARADGLITSDPARQSPAFLDSIRMKEIVRANVDWPLGERDSHVVTPVDSVSNAFYYRSLVLMGRIARAIGKPSDAAAWEEKASRVYQAYQTVFFVPETGLYRDGEGALHSSLHANLFPLAFDLVPAEHRETVTRFVVSKGMACSVYAAQYLLDALYAQGRDNEALALLTAHTKRSWHHMMTAGSTIAMEAWDNVFKPNQDWNHAWGAAPANLIPRRLMGVRIIEPGAARFLVEPRPGSLRSASLVLPTIRGTLTEVLTQSPSHWTLALTLPANTTALVRLPTRDPSSVTEGGRPLSKAPFVHGGAIVDDRVEIEVSSGSYQFEGRRSPAPHA